MIFDPVKYPVKNQFGIQYVMQKRIQGMTENHERKINVRTIEIDPVQTG